MIFGQMKMWIKHVDKSFCLNRITRIRVPPGLHLSSFNDDLQDIVKSNSF